MEDDETKDIPVKSRRRFLTYSLVGVGIGGAGLAGLLVGSNLKQEKQYENNPTGVLRRYLSAINEKDYDEAMDCLSSELFNDYRSTKSYSSLSDMEMLKRFRPLENTIDFTVIETRSRGDLLLMYTKETFVTGDVSKNTIGFGNEEGEWKIRYTEYETQKHRRK